MSDGVTPTAAPPRPNTLTGRDALDIAREQHFTGSLVLDVGALDVGALDVGDRVRLFFDRGELYVAERATDPVLADRLLALDVLTADQLGRLARFDQTAELAGSPVRVGADIALDRLFERVPTIDRRAVLAALELMNAEVTTMIAALVVRDIEALPDRHHPAGVHRWFSSPTTTSPTTTSPTTTSPTTASPAPFAPPTGAPLPAPQPTPVAPAVIVAMPVAVSGTGAVVQRDGVQRDDIDAWLDESDAVITWGQPVRLDAGSVLADDEISEDESSDDGSRGGALAISSDWLSGFGIDLPPRTSPSAEPPTGDREQGAQSANEPTAIEVVWPSGDVEQRVPEVSAAERATNAGVAGAPSRRTSARVAASRSTTAARGHDRPPPTMSPTMSLTRSGLPTPAPPPPTPAPIEIDWSVGAGPAATPADAIPSRAVDDVVDDLLAVVRRTVETCEDRATASRTGRRVDRAMESSVGPGGVNGPAMSAFDDAMTSRLAPAGGPSDIGADDRPGALRRLIGSLRHP